MENSKRKRGISLSHQHNSSHHNHSLLDKSVYVDPQPSTRLQYPRYHLASPSRHASAPKAKVQFAYPIHPLGGSAAMRGPLRHIQLPPEPIYVPFQPVRYAPNIPQLPLAMPVEIQQEPPIITQSIPLVLQVLPPQNEIKPVLLTEKEESKQQQLTNIQTQNIVIPEKYASYQQCKEAISKRLFGVSSSAKKENALQQTDRANRWAEEIMQECKQKSNVSQTSIQESIKEFSKHGEQIKKKQLNIQHQVVNYVAEAKIAKENARPTALPKDAFLQMSPAPQKRERKARDPLKLQEMEKRLMEIIKICDQNLS